MNGKKYGIYYIDEGGMPVAPFISASQHNFYGYGEDGKANLQQIVNKIIDLRGGGLVSVIEVAHDTSTPMDVSQLDVCSMINLWNEQDVTP